MSRDYPHHPLPAVLAMVTRGGKVLLAQRPSTGLWGGLWTFPERERGTVHAQVFERFGCEAGATRKLDPLEHGFTHFRLAIQPVRVEVRARGANRKGCRWMAPAAAIRAATPVPVRAILERLAAA